VRRHQYPPFTRTARALRPHTSRLRALSLSTPALHGPATATAPLRAAGVSAVAATRQAPGSGGILDSGSCHPPGRRRRAPAAAPATNRALSPDRRVHGRTPTPRRLRRRHCSRHARGKCALPPPHWPLSPLAARHRLPHPRTPATVGVRRTAATGGPVLHVKVADPQLLSARAVAA